MAADLNKVILIGRLTRDAELMYTNSGYPLTKLGVAVNRRRKSGEEWIDEPSFFDVNLWGKRGVSLQPYLTRGTQVGIDGYLRQERWEQDGAKRSKVVIEAEDIQLLARKTDGGGRSAGAPSYESAPRQGEPHRSPPPPAPPGNGGGQGFPPFDEGDIKDFEDDIPF